jgi:hypothetical protein
METMLAAGFSKVSIVHGKMLAVGFSKFSNIHGKDACYWFFYSF